MMRKNLKHNKLNALRVAGVLPIIGAGMMLFGFTNRAPEIVYTSAETYAQTSRTPGTGGDKGDGKLVPGYASDPPTKTLKTVKVAETELGKGVLILVDGKELKGGLDKIDPATIERIDVLKDAAAVEKYGRKAKNGVVVVTRKADLIDVGYGKVDRRENTSAAESLDMREAYSYSNLREYIQGRVAGVTFIGDQLIIRGAGSINSGIEALVVVDGMPVGSFAQVNDSINPADVASISVLKDAGSTAIYGVRGANGVVLINTKRGQ